MYKQEKDRKLSVSYPRPVQKSRLLHASADERLRKAIQSAAEQGYNGRSFDSFISIREVAEWFIKFDKHDPLRAIGGTGAYAARYWAHAHAGTLERVNFWGATATVLRRWRRRMRRFPIEIVGV